MFCWRADDGPTLNAGLVALWFIRRSGSLLLRNPIIFVIFQGARTPCPHPPLAHGMMQILPQPSYKEGQAVWPSSQGKPRLHL